MSNATDPDVEAITRIQAIPTILQVITQTTGLRLSLVARVTADDWKACAVHDAMSFGLSAGDHLDVTTTLCSEVRDARASVVIEHASEDPHYASHPTPKLYKFESYVAVPIFLKNGDYFGNVCALDADPIPVRKLNAESMMTHFAQLIGMQLDVDAAVRETHDALQGERQTSELREQFIAVLGHDLRTPLSAIRTGADLLLGSDLPAPEQAIAGRIRSSALRMARLVDDVLDFTRGRLGGGIGVERAPIDDLDATLRHVVEEIAAANPTHDVRAELDDVGPVRGDRVRLGQLLSNLLANAIEHGTPGTAVEARLEGLPDAYAVSVTNHGEPIPVSILPRLFQPYVRRTRATEPRSGLGLGLYIVSEIVRSHGGTISVTSTADEGTTFRCVMPRDV